MQPTNGSVAPSGQDVTITASADDADDVVVKVDFDKAGDLLGSDTDASDGFSWQWSVPPLGAYALTAEARDTLGATGVSAPASVTVAMPGDASLDNVVDLTDLGILAGNWGQSPRDWTQADFSGDQLVNLSDLGILAGNWGYGTASQLDQPAASITTPLDPVISSTTYWAPATVQDQENEQVDGTSVSSVVAGPINAPPVTDARSAPIGSELEQQLIERGTA
jgi:hypothetical protein